MENQATRFVLAHRRDISAMVIVVKMGRRFVHR
jgi:hypothetical protein